MQRLAIFTRATVLLSLAALGTGPTRMLCCGCGVRWVRARLHTYACVFYSCSSLNIHSHFSRAFYSLTPPLFQSVDCRTHLPVHSAQYNTVRSTDNAIHSILNDALLLLCFFMLTSVSLHSVHPATMFALRAVAL